MTIVGLGAGVAFSSEFYFYETWGEVLSLIYHSKEETLVGHYVHCTAIVNSYHPVKRPEFVDYSRRYTVKDNDLDNSYSSSSPG